jgi:ATP-dependent DNA ligase
MDGPDPRVPFPPMEAELTGRLPIGERWQYEPKWDGFRGVLENASGELRLWSRNGRPLLRYFPELRELGDRLPPGSALDGEIVIEREGVLDFDAMQQRLHPAESRIRKLAAETPATYVAFDILLWDGVAFADRPLRERRRLLEQHAAAFTLSPKTSDPAVATHWLARLEAIGLDGVICKRLDLPYKPGSREAVMKVKPHKTCDCVIVGYRNSGTRIATLLLGLYDNNGTLDFVGHTSGITGTLQKDLQQRLPPLIETDQRGHLGAGRTPGGESRWSRGKELDWTPVRPEIVCEVRYDKMETDRFRHGTRFLRFRPDKEPMECRWTQVRPTRQPGDPTLGSLLT